MRGETSIGTYSSVLENTFKFCKSQYSIKYRTQQVRRKVERMPRPNNFRGTSCDGTFGGIDTIG